VRAAITITARDAHRRRVREGGQGAEVVVKVAPSKGGTDIIADVTDRGDGSYIAVYEVPERGNYSVRVEVEGMEIDGSPYPVFFSAHDPNAAAAAAAETASYLAKFERLSGADGGAAGESGKAPKMIGSTVAPPPIYGPSEASLVASLPGMPQIADQAAYAAAVQAAQASSAAIPYTLQAQAKYLAVKKGPDVFSRCVAVYQFPGALITAEALRTIMGVTGVVKDAQVRGGGWWWVW